MRKKKFSLIVFLINPWLPFGFVLFAEKEYVFALGDPYDDSAEIMLSNSAKTVATSSDFKNANQYYKGQTKNHKNSYDSHELMNFSQIRFQEKEKFKF